MTDMSSGGKAVGMALLAALELTGCAAQDAGTVSRLNSGAQSRTGATAGSMPGTAAPAAAEKEQRGNTPPGMDRDGHGPASGAIVDPTGAATQRTR